MARIDELTVNSLRILSVDAVERAKSGHPGMAIGAAPIIYELYAHHLKFNPKVPDWRDRDRFILSAGHGSALLYSTLHMFGYGITIEDLKSFRKTGSVTPGHPEYGHTVGVEATTGPLGQGIAMAVGMAIAQKHLASVFNRPGFQIYNNRIYALSGDGCMMEGISSEAASLAGTLKLDNLTVLYDSNRISIEGSTDCSFCEDVGARFKAYGWNVIKVKDGENLKSIGRAIEASKTSDKPTLIIIDTLIARNTPLEGSEKSHGEPLGEKNISIMRSNLGWPYDEPFKVPEKVYKHCAKLTEEGEQEYKKWLDMMAEYKKQHPELYKLYQKYHETELPTGLENITFDKDMATRQASGEILNALKEKLPNLIGGSADLAPSNKTVLTGIPYFSAQERAGRNIHFGVREHAMSAIANGLALYGGLMPYVATFLIFSDYMKHSIRLSALMKQRVIYIMTHDSIGVGEDGPTHQPIEQLAAFRAMPNCTVFRPADAKETVAAYIYALKAKGPTVLALSRQSLPILPGFGLDAGKGAYVIFDVPNPKAIIIATGSEVNLAVAAAGELRKRGVNTRVVSMPSMEVFDEQSKEYKNSILIPNIPRVAVEAAASFGWHKYVGENGEIIAMDTFGASGPAKELFPKFGFTVENIVSAVERVISSK